MTLEQLFPNQSNIKFILAHKTESQRKTEIKDNHSSITKLNIGPRCERHTIKIPNNYCFTCNKSICNQCVEEGGHSSHTITDKFDFLADSEVIVNDIFRDISSQLRNLNLDNQDEINKLRQLIKHEYFPNLLTNLDMIQSRLIQHINTFENNNKMSRNNMNENISSLESNCVEGLNELKNKISIKDILINEEIFLTFNAKLIQLAEEQGRLVKDGNNYVDNCNLVNEFNVESYNIYGVIKKKLDEVIKLEDFERVMIETKGMGVKKIEKSEIINNLLEGMDNKMNSEKNSKSNNYRRSIFPSQKLSLHQEYSNEENKSNINGVQIFKF